MENQIRFYESNSISCIVGDKGFLGKGSFGVVRCGFHSLHGIVAVKCTSVQGKPRSRSALEKRIKAETNLLQKANHENVVRVYGWTQWSRIIAIIMEFLPAGNLMDVLEICENAIEPLLCLRMCYEISNGIAFIHNILPDKKLVHGDIKPDNILLTEDLHCKISDFGGARLSTYTGKSKIATNNQPRKQYTELFAPPEVVENPTIKLVTSHDIYSFALTLFVLLNREIPVSEAYIFIYLEGVKKGQRPALDNINDMIRDLEKKDRGDEAKVIKNLIKVMQDCWQQDPSIRPAMLDVRNSLRQMLSGYDPVIIQQQAVNAVREMDISIPNLDHHECVTLDQLLPSDLYHNQDHFLTNHELYSASTSSTMPSKQSLPSATTYTSADALSSASARGSSLESSSEWKRQNLFEESEDSTRAFTNDYTLSYDFIKRFEVETKLINRKDFSEKDLDANKLICSKVESIKKLLEQNAVKNTQQKFSGQAEASFSNEKEASWGNVIEEIIEIASILEKNCDYSTAITMIKWAAELWENINDVTVKLKKIKTFGNSVVKIADALNNVDKHKEIEQLCVELLKELLTKVQHIQTTEANMKVNVQTNIKCQIALCYSFIGKHAEAEQMCQSGMHDLTAILSTSANENIVFAFCYFLSGTANKNMGNYGTAVEQYKESIKICQSAKDVNKEEVERRIEAAKDCLKEAEFYCPLTSSKASRFMP